MNLKISLFFIILLVTVVSFFSFSLLSYSSVQASSYQPCITSAQCGQINCFTTPCPKLECVGGFCTNVYRCTTDWECRLPNSGDTTKCVNGICQVKRSFCNINTNVCTEFIGSMPPNTGEYGKICSASSECNYNTVAGSIIAPNGGEILTPGTSYQVKWQPANQNEVQVILKDFSNPSSRLAGADGSISWYLTGSAVPNLGSWNWNLQSKIMSNEGKTDGGTKFKIKVEEALTGKVLGISSNYFTILPSTSTVIIDPVGTCAAEGQSYNPSINPLVSGISGCCAGLTIVYPVSCLPGMTGCTGTCQKTTSVVVTTPKSLSLLSPNGQENLIAGKNSKIVWQTTGFNPDADVYIALMQTSQWGSWEVLQETTTNGSGVYDLFIPSSYGNALNGSIYKIKVKIKDSSASDWQKEDISDKSFAIMEDTSSVIEPVCAREGQEYVPSISSYISGISGCCEGLIWRQSVGCTGNNCQGTCVLPDSTVINPKIPVCAKEGERYNPSADPAISGISRCCDGLFIEMDSNCKQGSIMCMGTCKKIEQEDDEDDPILACQPPYTGPGCTAIKKSGPTCEFIISCESDTEDTTQTNSNQNNISIPSGWCHGFNGNLGYANSGSSEVVELHRALKKEGISYGLDDEDEYGEDTMEAIIEFQKKYNIKQTGYTGLITRNKLNELYRCSTVNSDTSSQGATLSIDSCLALIDENQKLTCLENIINQLMVQLSQLVQSRNR